MHLAAIINSCNNAVSDEDKDTAERVVGAARVLGAHVPPAEWLPLALEAVTADKTAPPQVRLTLCRTMTFPSLPNGEAAELFTDLSSY
jgi:hypothetical protein